MRDQVNPLLLLLLMQSAKNRTGWRFGNIASSGRLWALLASPPSVEQASSRRSWTGCMLDLSACRDLRDDMDADEGTSAYTRPGVRH